MDEGIRGYCYVLPALFRRERSLMKELVVDAKIENLEQVLDFVNGELEAAGCFRKVQVQLDITVEEIFVNIAHYAYEGGVGKAVIRMHIQEEPKAVEIIFMDWGMPYNPLEREDPDVTLSAEDRQIGGLGIYMVKKSMDDVSYEYKDGQNILIIQKKLTA